MNMNNILSFTMDDQTIISDITDLDNNTISSIDMTQKINEYSFLLESKLNELTNDILKEKCKELNIIGASKMKKNELIKNLIDEFNKLCLIINDKKIYELKIICKTYKIKSNTKKNDIILNILNHCLTNVVLKFDTDTGVIKISEKPDISLKSEKTSKKKENEIDKIENENSANQNVIVNILDNLEKQKMEIELKMKEVLEKEMEEKRKVEEIEKKLKESEDKKKIDEEIEKKRIEETQKRIEKEEAKKKKQSIPKQVRTIVWNHYIGEDIIKHKCLCCKKVTICNTNFDVGHVISEKNAGTHEINNLRPICGSCNHSMGTENMVDFVVKYGLYIG